LASSTEGACAFSYDTDGYHYRDQRTQYNVADEHFTLQREFHDPATERGFCAVRSEYFALCDDREPCAII
jgi:hypothetical protein